MSERLRQARERILATDELYPKCPRCDGHKLILAETNYGSEWLNCPLCGATGEADRDAALEWINQHIDREG